MNRVIGLLILLLCNFAYAADECEERAKIAGTMVIIKNSTIESLKKKPMSGPMGEVWRHMAFLGGEGYEQLGDDKEHIVATVKVIEKNSFSDDWRVDFFIFREYFQGVCEQGLDVLTLPPIEVKALSECFKDNPKGDEKFKLCVRDQVSRKTQ